MRGIFIVIALTLFLTGLDAAAHVFGYAMAAPQSQQHMAGMMDCCPKSHHDHDAQMKCSYCCAAVIGLTDAPVPRFVAPRITVAAVFAASPPHGPSYGLFRPPKSAARLA